MNNSTEVLKWLENVILNFTPKTNIKGFSWDFVSLYDNIRPELVLEAVDCAMNEIRPDWNKPLKSWILSLINLSMQASSEKYGDSW